MSELKVTAVDNRGDAELAYGFVYFTDSRRVGYTSTKGVDKDVTGNWGGITDTHVRLASDYLRTTGILSS